MVKTAPSVLSANFVELKAELESIKKSGADWIHYDVMDGHFVPNISFGYSILQDISKVTDLYLDVHLMISEPKKYIHSFIKAGASLVTFHVEAINDEKKVFALIDELHHAGVDVGISVKPMTPVSQIEKYLERIDLVLVMSVEPGFGGQTFQNKALEKIRQLTNLKEKYSFLIEVDGGINDETGLLCKQAGADVLVAGSYFFHAEDRKAAVDSLK